MLNGFSRLGGKVVDRPLAAGVAGRQKRGRATGQKFVAQRGGHVGEVLPGALTSRTIVLGGLTAAPEVVVVSGVDRCGNEGKAAAAALTGLQ